MTPTAGYTEMKDSSIPWIGEIPKSWDIVRGKNIIALLERPVNSSDDVITCFRDGEVTLRKNRREEGFTNSLKEIGYQGVNPGDLVVHGMDGFAGSIGISDSRGKASPVLNVLDSTQNKRYLMYYLRGMAYKDVFMALSTGIRVRSCDLRWNKLSVFPFLLPSLSEQSAIAAYLDAQCAKIDEIIAEAKASIEDYKQWKASIIYEAVTKGLDPNAEMKDSGISSFGKIPAHWEIYRFQILCKLRSEDNSGGRELLSVYLDRGVIKYSDSSGMQVHKPSDSLEKYQNVYVNDFVMNNQQAWRGSVGVSKYNGIVSPAYHVYELSEDCFPQYMSYLLRDSSMVQQYELASRGVGTIQRNIYEPWLRKSYIALPTLAEQAAIAAYLDAKCAKIDMLVKEKQGFIIDLEAYKKSLIYEVVTGKRRVC